MGPVNVACLAHSFLKDNALLLEKTFSRLVINHFIDMFCLVHPNTISHWTQSLDIDGFNVGLYAGILIIIAVVYRLLFYVALVIRKR